MLKKLIVLSGLVIMSFNLFAQQEDVYRLMDDAKDYYKSQKYREAAASLQEAINKINDIIGDQILKGLPPTINGMSYDKSNDNVTSLGTLMGAGMTAQRVYVNEKGETVTVQITPNDPMVENLITFISNPQDYGTESDAGKVIKMNEDMKALCKFLNTEQQYLAYLQMPFYTSKIVFEGSGFKKEEDFVKACQQINWEKLAEVMGYKQK